jgi:hypothetical protein
LASTKPEFNRRDPNKASFSDSNLQNFLFNFSALFLIEKMVEEKMTSQAPVPVPSTPASG